jgi:DNA-binding GntR family transcriptional regulator
VRRSSSWSRWIIDTLLAGDAPGAAAAMARHIDDVGRSLEQTLFDRQPPEK